MTSALRLYRAVVVGGDDPEGLGRVRLRVERKVRGVPVPFEGWAGVGSVPLAAGVEAVPSCAPGDHVLYAAERLPFVGAVVVCRERAGTPWTGAGPVSLRIALGPGQDATVEASGGWLRVSTTAGHEIALRPDGSLAVAAGQVTVDAGMAKFSGVLQCDTLIANTVVAATYTPGAGNLV